MTTPRTAPPTQPGGDVSEAAVRAFEARIDAEYEATLPARSFEEGAYYLLLAYEWHTRQGMMTPGGPKFDFIDLGKFALMHAFNWARTRPRDRGFGLPAHPDGQRADDCLGSLQRGLDYTGVYVTFSGYSRGTMVVTRLDDGGIEFAPAIDDRSGIPGRAHFDMLDRMVYAEDDPNEFAGAAKAIGTISSAITAGAISGRWLAGQLHLRLEHSALPTIRAAVSGVRTNRHFDLLPDEWSFQGLALGDFRAFWDALFIIVHAHLALTLPRHQAGGFPSESVLAYGRANWELLIAQVSGLERASVQRLIALHAFEPDFRQADVALTPFVDLGAGIVALSPNLVSGGAVERNFYAHAARRHKQDIDAASGVLAPTMARQLAAVFAVAGFQTATGVPVQTAVGNTDIDLLIWSPGEGMVLACELKWFVKSADFKEVLEREKACTTSVREQLPRYASALTADPRGLLSKAFPGHAAATIVDAACCLLLRGFVGGASVPREQFSTIPEPLLREQLAQRPRLATLIKWVRSMPFLPRAGLDFTLRSSEILTPSGTRVVTPSFEPGPPRKGRKGLR